MARHSRGHIQIRNFLPPDEIEGLIKLYGRVQGKTLMISKTLGIPGGKLIDESDLYDDVKVFQAFKDEYEGDITPMEELRLKWLGLVRDDPTLPGSVGRLPDGISVGKLGHPAGLFTMRRVPVLVKTDEHAEPEWSLKPGRIEWALKTADGVERGLLAIDAAIQTQRDASAKRFTTKSELLVALREFERDETKRLRKEVQLPLDAPAPETLAWIEVI